MSDERPPPVPGQLGTPSTPDDGERTHGVGPGTGPWQPSAPIPPAWAQPATGGYRPPPWEDVGGVRPATLRTLSSWTQGLLWANVATMVVVAMSVALLGVVLANYQAGRAPLSDVSAAETALGAVLVLLAGPVYVATVVLLLVWQHHLHRQLTALRGVGALRWPAGLAVGCWFIPLANLAMPAVAVCDLWRASTRPDASRPDPVPVLLHWWWGLFVVAPAVWFALSFVLGFVEGLLDPSGTTSALDSPAVTAASAAIWAGMAVAAGLGARVVANLTRRTDRLASHAGW